MLVAEGGSQIRVGGLLGGASAAPASAPSRSGYAADWNPPSSVARSLPGTSCWPIPGRSDLGSSVGGSASGSASSTLPGISCWPTPGYATAGGMVFDRSPSPTPSPSAGPAPSAPGSQPSSSGPRAPSTPATPTPTPGVQSPAAPPPTPAQVAAKRQELQTAKIDASLAQDVYKDPPNPPAGYHVANDKELAKLGLTPQMLEDGRSNFRARVYVGQDGRTVVAFRGSQTKEDWKNDIQEGTGLNSEYYDRAIDIGQRIARSGQDVTFTGHSLGGGLASAAAVASGGQADTFNAAGINGDTVFQAKVANIAAGGQGKDVHVDAYYDSGDPLSKFQDSNAFKGGLIGGVLGGIFGGGLPGIVLGAIAGHAPSAYGDRHVLATIDPPGGGSITDRHGMDYVQRGLDSALNQLH